MWCFVAESRLNSIAPLRRQVTVGVPLQPHFVNPKTVERPRGARIAGKRNDRWPASCSIYRRSGKSLEIAGGKDLKTGDVVVLGEDAIHAIANPLDHVSCAIHIYGGDLLNFSGRSTWNPFTFEEHPYDINLLMDYSRQLRARASS
jgi:hypothetical protein